MVLQAAVNFAVGDLAQLGKELVAHGDDLGGVGLHVVNRLLQRRSQSHDTGHVLRAAPAAPLLGAALDQVEQGHVLLGVQHAHALGRVELMAGDAEHVDVHFLHVDGHMACGLHRVGVEGNALLPAEGADLPDGLNGADLVVGKHNGHKGGVLPDSGGYVLKTDYAVLVHIQKRDLIALFFQLFQGVQHRVVLEFGGDQVLFPFAGAGLGGGDDGLVVSLAAAGGEVDLPGLGVQAGGNGGPGLGHGLGGLLGKAVQAGGVAVVFGKVGQHGVQRGLAYAGGGCIIGVYKHCAQILSVLLMLFNPDRAISRRSAGLQD